LVTREATGLLNSWLTKPSNSELGLDRRLVDKRISPPINMPASGTRKQELLLHPDELEKVYVLRRVLSDMNPVESVELLRNRLAKVESNRLFLMTMNLA
jgi:transcription termination factor Rho